MNADKDGMWWEEVMRFLVFFAFFLMSCGQDMAYTDLFLVESINNRGDLPIYIEEEFIPYVQEFEQLYGRKITNLPIVFGETQTLDRPMVVGYCQVGGVRDFVVIDEDTWLENDDTFRRILIWHELSHCILGRNHRDDVLDDGSPASITNSVISYDLMSAFVSNREYYEWELFNFEE